MSVRRLLVPLVALVAVVAVAAPASTLPAGDRDRDAGVDADARVELVIHHTPGGGEPAAAALAAHPHVTRVRSVPQLDVDVVAVPADQAEQVRAELASTPGVAHVERDGTATTARTPDDPRWADQWGLPHVDAPTAWATTTGDPDQTIAVLDTGVDPDHPDLAANLVTGRDFTIAGGGGTDTSDHDDPPSGQAGHGTMVAGVLGAVTDNAEGIAGTCWRCTLMPVRVMEPDGRGALSRIAAGMVWAVDNGAAVLNLSLGSPDDTLVMRDAVRYALDHDVAMVAAAGNFADAEPVYPAAYEAVVGVAASSPLDSRYEFSSYGSWVHVAAPGCSPSTVPGGDYTGESFCGTSAAAPLASAAIALALDAEPDATPWQALEALTSTAEPVGDWVRHGRIDVAATLAAMPETGTTSAPPPPDESDEPDADDGDADTEPGVTLRRVAGSDRFDTAARLSHSVFEPGVARVYLATGAAFPDALAAGAAAGAMDGPVLLASRASLPGATRTELERLQPDSVVVVGGTGVLDDNVRAAAGQAAGAPTRRLAGADRFATAAAVARDTFPGSVPVAYVATGEAFADALAGVPAAAEQGGPVLLTARDHLPDATRRALEQLSPHRIVVLGGPAAVSTSVAGELGGLAGPGGVERLAGADRFATAAQVSRATFGVHPAAVHLATGADFPDALAGGPAAAVADGPLLLVTRETLPTSTGGELDRLRPAINVTLGGTGVISEQVEAAAGAASAGGG